MPRFFIERLESPAVLTGEDAAHIQKSLRMREGDALTLCDGRGKEADAAIASCAPGTVTCTFSQVRPSLSEPAVRLSLFQAWPKGDKADWIVQKATELGVSEIRFLLTEFCVARPKPQDMERKLARLQKIANEAAKQCGRGVLPAVSGFLTLREAAGEMKRSETALFFYERSTSPLNGLLPAKTASLSYLVGSEGGFSEAEARLLEGAGIPAASLGRRVLRCETAPIAAAAAFLYHFGEV